MARKSFINEWTTEEALLLLEGWARDGLNYADIAHNIGICLDTLVEWRKKEPKIEAALRAGREVIDRRLENALIKKALGGYEITETRVIDDEKNGRRVETVTKIAQPDVTALIFALKNRKPDVWRDRQERHISADVEDLSPLVELLK